MRLTNVVRDDFIVKVMNNTPWKSKYTKDVACKEIQRRGDALLPKDVQAFIKKHPHLINRSSNYEKLTGAYVYLVRGQELSSIDYEDIKEQYNAYAAEKSERANLRSRLSELAYSAKTLKQLHDLMPELAAYMPKDEATAKQLPVAVAGGLVAELVKAGLKVEKA